MSLRLRLLLVILMTAALAFGFLHLFVPAGAALNYERLHIFLFNLCAGGTILIHFTEDQPRLSRRGKIFLGLSLGYAVLAFLRLYLPAMAVAIVLSILVEQVRARRFPRLPTDLFDPTQPVAAKFHHAALLCLGLGLAISSLVIANSEFLRLIPLPGKLTLDTFFLGFSFPLSLITMSVMFSLMAPDPRPTITLLKHFSFWSVNLGVVVFFLFILLERFMPQVVVTSILFGTVLLVFALYARTGRKAQQKNFLTSGMVFLLFTSVTGIVYIILEMFPAATTHEAMAFLLKIHAFSALYGWNLSGLAVICRQRDFPIRLHSKAVIGLHWVTVILLAPLGLHSRLFAIVTVICYLAILIQILMTQKSERLDPHGEIPA